MSSPGTGALLWALVVVSAAANLLFVAATVGLVVEGNIGAGFVGALATAVPAFVAWKSVTALRGGASARAVGPEATASQQSTPPSAVPPLSSPWVGLVSYTHLDVYKRQIHGTSRRGPGDRAY